MTDLKKNIDRYMDRKSIKYYSDLLVHIGRQLKIKDPYAFAEKEKSNFSKMLRGERPLKHEYIIPLEKIFGVSMARLMDDGAYLLPQDKEEMRFIKGFRYYAFKDDPDLFENECVREMVDSRGKSTLGNYDEFFKGLLDYIGEYRSIKLLRHLVKKHYLHAVGNRINSYACDLSSFLYIATPGELYKMVIQEDDVELFERLFDPYLECVTFGIPFDRLQQDLVDFELILNAPKIFEHLFVPKEESIKKFNNGIQSDEMIKLINPFFNVCLDVALSELDRYRDKARRMLEFGIKYNEQFLRDLNANSQYLYLYEYGVVRYGYTIYGTLVYAEYETEDKEMLDLISQLHLPPRVQ